MIFWNFPILLVGALRVASPAWETPLQKYPDYFLQIFTGKYLLSFPREKLDRKEATPFGLLAKNQIELNGSGVI